MIKHLPESQTIPKIALHQLIPRIFCRSYVSLSLLLICESSCSEILMNPSLNVLPLSWPSSSIPKERATGDRLNPHR